MSPSVSARLLLTQSDARLIAFARAGHERAFEALVRRYRGPLLGYCRRLLLSEERAEDALQQALMQAWLALRAGTEVQSAKAWLYRIVHNSALNALRVSGYDYCTLSESLSGADAPQEDLDRRIAVREALAGLAALPEMQREALLRTAVEGSSHRQAARELGLSEPALRGLVYRARATLRAAAGAFVPGPVLSWALSSGGGGPGGASLAEVGAGGGGAGVAGLLMKGGAMAVTAGVLAGGIAAVHAHPQHAGARRTPLSAPQDRDLETARIAPAGAAAMSTRPVTDVQRTSLANRLGLAAGSARPKATGVGGHRRGTRVFGPGSAPAWPHGHGGERRGGAAGGGTGDEQRTAGGDGTGTNVGSGAGSNHDGGGRGPNGEASRSGDGGGGSSGDEAQGGATGGDHSGQGERPPDTNGGGESSSGDYGAQTTTTNAPPTSEPSPVVGEPRD